MNNIKIAIFDFISSRSKEFITTTVAQCLYLLQNVIQNKIFTSYFDTATFGKWSLLMSVYTLVSMLPFSAIDQGIYRNAYECRENGQEKQLCSIAGIVYFPFFILYSIVFFALNKIQGVDFFASGYGVMFALYAFTEILKNTYVLMDNAYRNRNRVLIIRVFGITSRTVLFLLCNYTVGLTLSAVLRILFWTNIFILIYQFRFIRQITFKLDFNVFILIFKKVITFSLPLMIWAIFGWMQNMILRWYLDALLDLEAVALYSVLTTLSFFVPNAIYTTLNAYVMPVVISKNYKFTRKSLLKYLLAVLAVLMVYFVLVCFGGKYMVLLLADAKYLAILKYLPITTLSSILYVIAMLSTIEIYRREKTKKLIVVNIMPGLITAIVGYYLISKFALNGAILTYVLGHLIYAVLAFIVVFNKKNIITSNQGGLS